MAGLFRTSRGLDVRCALLIDGHRALAIPEREDSKKLGWFR